MIILVHNESKRILGASLTNTLETNESGNDIKFSGVWYAALKESDVTVVDLGESDYTHEDGRYSYDFETETIQDISSF